MKKKVKFDKMQYFYFIILVFFGVMVGVQFRSMEALSKNVISSEQLLNEYKSQLEKEQNRNKELNDKINELQEENKKYIEEYGDKDNDEKELVAQLNKAKFYAGLTDVKGPGIEIVMADAKYVNSKDPLNGVSDYIIHDRELSQLINDLQKAGAEAISINDERICALSEQICMGPTIRINNKKLTPPFTVKAIGKAKKLEKSMLKSNLFYSYEYYGKTFKIIRKKNIRIGRLIRIGDING